MQEIKTVALIGAGAVGASHAKYLHASLGPEYFRIIASEDRIRRYTEDGIYVNHERMPFQFVSPQSDDFHADLILVGVKFSSLPQAISDIRNFVGTNTTILSLLNGVTSEEEIAKVYGEEKLLFGYTLIDTAREGKSIISRKPGKIVFGEKDNRRTCRVEAVKAVFDKAGILTDIPHDILHELWWKYLFNTGINPLATILGGNIDLFQKHEEVRHSMILAQREIIDIAKHAEISLSDADIDRVLRFFDTATPGTQPSMCQDVAAKRKTEIDMLCGTAVNLGRSCGIQTPVNELLLNMVKAIEDKYLSK